MVGLFPVAGDVDLLVWQAIVRGASLRGDAKTLPMLFGMFGDKNER